MPPAPDAQPMSTAVLIVSLISLQNRLVFHSSSGHTARRAEAVRRGIERVTGASVLYLTSDEAQGRLDDLDLADAIIFGAPTYMGSMSGPFETFMDATSKTYSTRSRTAQL